MTSIPEPDADLRARLIAEIRRRGLPVGTTVQTAIGMELDIFANLYNIFRGWREPSPDALATHRQISGRSYNLAPGDGSFFGDVFHACRFKLSGWDGRFLNCVFIDCHFDPPIDISAEPWGKHQFGSIMQGNEP